MKENEYGASLRERRAFDLGWALALLMVQKALRRC
jgi:hypothetical protein